MKKIVTRNYTEKARDLSRQTGITMKDILVVLKASEQYDVRAFSQGDGIKWGKSYTVYPEYREPRTIYNVHTNKQDKSTPHYILRVNAHERSKMALDFLNKSKR